MPFGKNYFASLSADLSPCCSLFFAHGGKSLRLDRTVPQAGEIIPQVWTQVRVQVRVRLRVGLQVVFRVEDRVRLRVGFRVGFRV